MSQAECPHGDAHIAQRVCRHLWQEDATSYAHRFGGEGLAHDLLCEPCAAAGAAGEAAVDEAALVAVCAACFDEVAARGAWIADEHAVVGAPPIAERATQLTFSHEMVRLPVELGAPLWDMIALPGAAGSRWLAVTRAGALYAIDLDRKEASRVADLAGAGVEPDRELSLCASPDGEMVAVVEAHGPSGVVVEVESGDISTMLDRGEPAEGARFPVAFAAPGGRLVLIHASAWNRLELSDPRTGDPLVRRPAEQAAAHQVEYASAGLLASPDGAWLVDNGYTAEGAGLVAAFSVRRWLEEDPFEADDGAGKRYLCQRWHHWDGPLTWIDPTTLAVHGYGPSRASLRDAVLLFDVPSGEPVRWFPGPRGPLVADAAAGLLYSLGDGDGVSVWDLASGERLLHDAGFHPLRHHPGTGQLLTTNPAGDLFVVSRLVGDPGTGGGRGG